MFKSYVYDRVIYDGKLNDWFNKIWSKEIYRKCFKFLEKKCIKIFHVLTIFYGNMFSYKIRKIVRNMFEVFFFF